MEALLPQPLGDPQTAPTQVAKNNDPPLLVYGQIFDAGREFAHREQRRTLDPDTLMLSRFATVKQEEIGGLLPQFMNAAAINFDWQRFQFAHDLLR